MSESLATNVDSQLRTLSVRFDSGVCLLVIDLVVDSQVSVLALLLISG